MGYSDPAKAVAYKREWRKRHPEEKAAHAAYQREYRKIHPRKYERISAKAARERLRQFVEALKERCAKCGFSACKRALDFHHRLKTSKLGNVGDAWRRGWSKKRILTEASKCDVLCANCHRQAHCGAEIAVTIP